MLFHPDTSKQTQKMVFSHKKINYLWSYFLQQFSNNKGEYAKTPRSVFGYKINENINENINKNVKKANKGISVIKKLNLSLSHS